MKYLLLLLTVCCSLGSSAQIPSCTAGQLAQRVQHPDTVYVVNFWATWCAPCVQELPAFDTVQEYYQGKPVKVLLVSLDFKDDYRKKIPDFVAKKHTKPDILWFSETDAEVFIPKIDNRWTGSIPATWIVSKGNGYTTFLDRTVSAAELKTLISPQLAGLSARKSTR